MTPTPTNAEMIFWLGALVVGIIATLVLIAKCRRVSEDYAESWRDDDKY